MYNSYRNIRTDKTGHIEGTDFKAWRCTVYTKDTQNAYKMLTKYMKYTFLLYRVHESIRHCTGKYILTFTKLCT